MRLTVAVGERGHMSEVGSHRHQIAKYRPWLHRWELIGVSEEDESALGRKSGEQAFEEAQVDHRGFVENDQRVGERKVLVVAVVTPSGMGAQETVEGLTGRRLAL
jgi:hypothetical protein